MASNLTIESPNFEKINKEAGQFTSDAINVLWSALNAIYKSLRGLIRQAQEQIEPKVISLSPSASVDNLDLQGGSVVSFTGGTQNFTGARAPETGAARVLWVQNSGVGTITLKNTATSETANQFATATGADYSMTTGKGIMFVYLASKWRELARSG